MTATTEVWLMKRVLVLLVLLLGLGAAAAQAVPSKISTAVEGPLA